MTFPVVGSNIPLTYEISNSLRFNDNDSARLTKTFGSAGTRTTWTFSTWVKRSLVNDGTNQRLFASGSGTSVLFSSIEYASDKIRILEGTESGSATTVVRGAGLNRDVSAWQHVFIKYDSTEGTASNRIKIYLNGVEVSYDSTTYPALNYNSEFGNNVVHTIGATSVGSSVASFFDGYMAETHFIDGTAKAHTDFGEFDEDSGVWKPKQYAGTYGTNGFYLKFNNTGNMGEDSSGNDNTFTPVNLSGTTDVTTDTPTNNFCTWNPLVGSDSGGATYYLPTTSEGNLKIQPSNASQNPVGISTIGMTTGKWYAEFRLLSETDTGAGSGAGVTDSIDNFQQENVQTASQIIYNDDGNVINRTSSSASGTTFTTSDIIGIALDIDNGFIYFSKNGTYINSGDPTSGGSGTGGYSLGTAQGEYFFIVQDSRNGNISVFDANFGSPYYSISSGNSDENGYGNFEYAPPSGYLALCTQNLATALSPTIDDGSQYFETTTYTGNASTLAITSLNFQPDFLWIKRRSSASTHALFNSNVGRNKSLGSESTDAEYTSPSDKDLISFDSNGFTVAQPSQRNVNGSGQTFVGWSWKANGGTTSSNTDGDITSTVQVNATAGFSIVQFTKTGDDQAVGHGLGKKPKLIIIKPTNTTGNWIVMPEIDGVMSNKYLLLNSTDALGTDGSYAEPTSSVFYVSNQIAGNNTHIGYVFTDIEGYSKFGSYTGNGSTDGTFIYTGFRPAFVLTKRTDSTSDWHLDDSARDTFNVTGKRLFPNLSNAEDTGASRDFLSNGFKIRNTFGGQNTSGGTYIYMAFAENPFVTSGATPVTAR